MEQWIFYAVATSFIWAITNIIDKHFLDRKFKDVITYMLIGGLLSIIFLPSMAFSDFSGIPPVFLICNIGLGIFLFACTLFYIKSLSCEDASIVIPFGSITSVFVLAMAFVFLGERLAQNQLISFGLLLLGGFFLVIRDFNIKKIIFSPALKYLLASCILYSIFDISNKFILGTIPAFEGFVLLRMGYFIACAAFLVSIKFRSRIFKQFGKLSVPSKLLIAINTILGLLGFITFNMAVSSGNISLVSASQGIQYAFVFIFATAVATFSRKINEDVRRDALIKKIIGIIVISLGIWLLNFSG